MAHDGRCELDAAVVVSATTTGTDPGVAHAHGVPPASERSKHRQRVALSGLLLALVATAVVVRVVRASAGTSSSVVPAVRKTLVQTPAPQVPPPAPTDVAREFGGCQLSLSGAAAVVPVGSCTVLEVGDSLGNDLGWGLAREVPANSGITLVQRDKSATGLANSGYYDWPTELETDLSLYHPQLVLICLGGDDEQGMVVDGSALQFPSAAWEAAYLARVRQLLDEATASGALVMWVGIPIMQDPGYSQGVKILNTLYQQVAGSTPDAVFVPTWQVFADPEGAYQAAAVVNGTPERLREPDGIHYSFVGENVTATYVIDEIASLFHVQLAPRDPSLITAW